MERDGKMDVHLDVPNDGFAGRLDVIEGPSGRRRRSAAEKRADRSGKPDAGGTRCRGRAPIRVTRWQVYDWRKQLRSGRLAPPESASCEPAFASLVVEEPSTGKATEGVIELVVGDVVIRAEPGVDDRHLSRVIRIVRGAQ